MQLESHFDRIVIDAGCRLKVVWYFCEQQESVILLELIQCGVAVGYLEPMRPTRGGNKCIQPETRSIELLTPIIKSSD